jgi:hypothetical protein
LYSGMPPLPRIARVAIAVLGVLLVASIAGWLYLRSRGNAILQEAGQRWLATRIATLSDSVYATTLFGLRYEPVTRSLRFDSVTVMTDVVRNQARTQPLPTLLVTVRGGRITGIDAWEITRLRRVHVREVGYQGVTALVTLPPVLRGDSAEAPRPAGPAGKSSTRPAAAAPEPARQAPPDTAAPDSAEGPVRPPRTSLVVVGADAPPPAQGERTVQVDRVRFENVDGRLSIPTRDGTRDISLAGLTLDLDAVSFDGHRDATTPFRASDARVRAKAFSGLVDRDDRLTFADLAVSIADSTLAVRDFRLAPAEGDSAFFGRRAHRATRTLVSFERLEAGGIDWVGLILGTNVAARRIAVDGLVLDLLLDKRKPPRPGPRGRKPSPQERLAAVRVPLAIDSIVLKNAAVRYAERVAQSPRPGRLRFERIDGALTNLTNDPARQTEATPARLEAHARFMGSGALDAVLEFPLLAPDYRARYRATLGPMPATALNEMIVPLVGAEVKEGDFVRVRIDARVRNGVHSGLLVPEFRNLGVRLPQTAKQKREEKGVKGFFKGVIRDAKAVAANTFVRDDNVSQPGKPARTGRIRYARTPSDSFFSSLWKGLKPALMEAVVMIKL